MLRLIARAMLLALLATNAGCALFGMYRSGPPGEVPLLRLAPAALPGGMAEQQRLTFDWKGRTETIDALVEVDPTQVRVVMHSQGQVAIRFVWDGSTLAETRAEWLPPQLTAERILSDLQMAFWPIPAVQQVIPGHWSFGGSGRSRALFAGDELVTNIEGDGDRTILRQNRHGYVLTIESKEVMP